MLNVSIVHSWFRANRRFFRACFEKQNFKELSGIARNKETLKAMLKIGAADEVSLSLASVSNSDIVVICTTVDTIASIYKKLVKIVKKYHNYRFW
jgi:prephenate dehydrogenase